MTKELHTHEHIHEEGHEHKHTHEHGHHHSPEEKKKQLNRISRAIGHLQHVNSALRSLGKEIINEHMTHCITHAIEDGDTEAVEEFQKAIKKFI